MNLSAPTNSHANNSAGISIKAATIVGDRIASHFLEPAVHDCRFQLDASPLLEKNHFLFIGGL
jgi:hypothetical protein